MYGGDDFGLIELATAATVMNVAVEKSVAISCWGRNIAA